MEPTPADTPQPPRTPKKRRIWLVLVIGAMLIAFGLSQLVLQGTSEAQTAAQVESQIAALPKVTPTQVKSPSVEATSPSAVAPSEVVKPTQAPAVKPESLPTSLTCQRAGIVDLSVLPLPPGSDPTIVDPPITPKAVFWNTSWISGVGNQKIGALSQATGIIQGHFLMDVPVEAGFPFNKLSYKQFFDVGDACVLTTANGSVLTYRVTTTVALTMEQWKADPKFNNLVGPNRGYDLILQACDAANPHVLKRLVGFKLVASS